MNVWKALTTSWNNWNVSSVLRQETGWKERRRNDRILCHVRRTSSARNYEFESTVRLHLDAVRLHLDAVRRHLDAVRLHLDAVRLHCDAVRLHLDAVRRHLDAVRHAHIATNALHVLNASVNFVVYCLVGHRFRRILGRRLTECRPPAVSGSDDVPEDWPGGTPAGAGVGEGSECEQVALAAAAQPPTDQYSSSDFEGLFVNPLHKKSNKPTTDRSIGA